MDGKRDKPRDSFARQEIDRLQKRFERLFREAEKSLPPSQPFVQGDGRLRNMPASSDKQLTLGWLSLTNLLRNFPIERTALVSALVLILAATIYLFSRGPSSPEPGMDREGGLTAKVSRVKGSAGTSTPPATALPEAKAKNSFQTEATAGVERQAQPMVLLKPRNQEELDQLLLDPGARQELMERIRGDRSFQIHQSRPTTVPLEYSPSDLATLVQHGILTQADVELLRVIKEATQRTVPMKE